MGTHGELLRVRRLLRLRLLVEHVRQHLVAVGHAVRHLLLRVLPILHHLRLAILLRLRMTRGVSGTVHKNCMRGWRPVELAGNAVQATCSAATVGDTMHQARVPLDQQDVAA